MRSPCPLFFLSLTLLMACGEPPADDDASATASPSTPTPVFTTYTGDILLPNGNPGALHDVWIGGDVAQADSSGHYSMESSQQVPAQIDVFEGNTALSLLDMETNHTHDLGGLGFFGGPVTVHIEVSNVTNNAGLGGEIAFDEQLGQSRRDVSLGTFQGWSQVSQTTWSIDTQVPHSGSYSVAVWEMDGSGLLADAAWVETNGGGNSINVNLSLSGRSFGSTTWDGTAPAGVSDMSLGQMVQVGAHAVQVKLIETAVANAPGTDTQLPFLTDNEATNDAVFNYLIDSLGDASLCVFSTGEVVSPGAWSSTVTPPAPTAPLAPQSPDWTVAPEISWGATPANVDQLMIALMAISGLGPGRTWLTLSTPEIGPASVLYPGQFDAMPTGQALALIVQTEPQAYTVCASMVSLTAL